MQPVVVVVVVVAVVVAVVAAVVVDISVVVGGAGVRTLAIAATTPTIPYCLAVLPFVLIPVSWCSIGDVCLQIPPCM